MKHVYITAALTAALIFSGTYRQASAAPKQERPVIERCGKNFQSSFAIITDSRTYEECRAELEAYKAVLEDEGLGTHIIHAAWTSPEEIRSVIRKLSGGKPALEGAVFVGDIPIVMVREAQFMTSAFKMNEQAYPPFQSSVPSDRFYDDFDLEFDFIGKDKEREDVFYYRLSETGSQTLHPDIYSARMKVPGTMEGDKYEIMRKYLAKVVAAHKEAEALDHLTYFAGHGYNSDCLTVWRQKPIVFREYFPDIFSASSRNRFLNFRQDRQMKWNLFNELQRPETDLFIFSEHGDFDTQYINETGEATGLEENLDRLKRSIGRMYLKYRGTEDDLPFRKEVLDSIYHLPHETLSDEALAEYALKDSIETANSNITLDDIMRLRSNPRMIVLNSCYNGSFHRSDGYVAGCHVFGLGNCIVAQGNTVNVLQDKWEDKLIGLLSCGERVGRWQKEINWLESHLIGDPTFRFAGRKADAALKEATRLTALADMTDGRTGKKAAAEKAGLSDEIYRIFCNDTSWIVRIHALDALGKFADDNCRKAILRGMKDPYELVVRTSCRLAGAMGNPEFAEALKSVIADRQDMKRAAFTAAASLKAVTPGTFSATIARIGDKGLPEAKRIDAMRTFRNIRAHEAADALINTACDPSEDETIRKAAAEVLGWYDQSGIRHGIVAALEGSMRAEGRKMPETVRKEMIKTIKRIERL